MAIVAMIYGVTRGDVPAYTTRKTSEPFRGSL